VSLGGALFAEKTKFNIVEIQEMFENYLEKKELTLEVRTYHFLSAAQYPGVDVMITIFCDFRQFSAKKLAFFSKTNVMIKILHYLALF
jgi:hypothetical protein